MKHQKKPYFPIFIDLSDKKVVVIGGGTIAERRIHTLADFTDNLTAVSPSFTPSLLDLGHQGLLTIIQRPYQREDLYGADLVIAATNDPNLNNDIHSVCKCLGITVNVCSDQTKCDFYFPGIARKDHLVAGITASGTDHKKAKEATQKIRQLLQNEFHS